MVTLDSIEKSVQYLKDLSIDEKVSGFDERENSNDDLPGEDDEDEDNEFLNSSSFLSNSQIIRSSNVNALKSSAAPAAVISSPTRLESQSSGTIKEKRRSHFQLFVPSTHPVVNSDNSDADDDQEEDQENAEKEENLSDDFIYKPTAAESSSMPQERLFRPAASVPRSRSSKFINIDTQSATPKLPRIHPDTTPWRQLRPPSMFLKENISIANQQTQSINDKMSSNFMKSFLDDNKLIVNDPSPTRSVSMFEVVNTGVSEESGSSSSSYELNNLRKQITNYKVQLRILAEYIRTLLNTSNNFGGLKNELMTKLEKENNALLNERESLQSELGDKKTESYSTEKQGRPYDLESDPKYISKINEILELKDDLISTKGSNEDLNSALKNLENEITNKTKEIELSQLKSSNWENLLNDLLSHLLNFLKGESAKAIIQAISHTNSIDTKIKVVTFAINELLEDFEELRVSATRDSTDFESYGQTSSDTFSASLVPQIRSELEASKATADDLKKLLTESSSSFTKFKNEYISLNSRYKENLQFLASLKKLLGEKQAEITDLNDKILELETNSIDRSEFESNEKDGQLLKNRINVMKANHLNEVELLSSEMDDLKTKLAQKQRESRPPDKTLAEELIKHKQEVQALKIKIVELDEDYHQNSQTYETAINNLKSLLSSSKQEIDMLKMDYQSVQKTLQECQYDLLANEKDYKRKMDHAAKELNQSVTKQRTLAAEKSKLAFALEDIKRENTRLGMNNNSLQDKVSRLSYQVSNLGNYEVGFKNLQNLSISNLQNLLNYFSNFLEPTSLQQAESKLKKVEDPSLTDLESIHSLLRSLLSYFENAIVSIMDEYSEMYAREAERNDQNDDSGEIQKLRDEVNSLTEELQWCYANGNFSEHHELEKQGELSPRTKMRLAELEKRRKLEREQRKSEHITFTARIKSLERENAELKEKMTFLEK
jgi:chromosome segregation ATPase